MVPASLKKNRVASIARHVLFPTRKKGTNPISLGYLRLTLCSKRDCVLFPTFPSSGTNWTGDVLSYIAAMSFLGRYDVTYLKGADRYKKAEQKPIQLTTPADSRSVGTLDLKTQLGISYPARIFHTHGAWHEVPMLRLAECRTIFMIRDLPTAIYSYYAKRRNSYESFDIFLEQSEHLERATRFYQSWGDYCQQYEGYWRVFTYGQARVEPERIFADMFEWIFNMKPSEDIVHDAIDYYSFVKQKEREYSFNKDESVHFHFEGRTNYKDRMAHETHLRLVNKFRNEIDLSIFPVLDDPESYD